MNYFSYLYQCDMIRVFPLRAGGYRSLASDGGQFSGCFPCMRGLSFTPPAYIVQASVFPLCGGYRGTTD